MSTREAPPVARITSRFHHGFRIEQQRLAASVSGLDDDASRERYASLLLDRLMFVFFVQAKGFLDGDPSYMQTKLAASRSEGPDRYFRRYLLPLFSDGLGALRDARSPEVTERIGDVPFLGARLFEPLPVERDHPELAVSDAAFAALYAFLGSYRWRLDERQLDDPGTEGEITPAVLGAVLERQVNREQMGAYYTRRDVTEHMAATAILPRLLAMVAHDVRAAAHLGSFPTPAECIRDNVDLRRLLPEAIGRSEDARFAAAVYDAVSCITVLDPACGSGAFLFAAMNVLAPAYTACLRRLGTTAAQPNLAYTVRKQIATQNLYGIDIMDEAVEICKLGLFLQLIACAERAEDFEPLPELGFNLRTANALTGFDWDGAFGAVSKRGGFDVVIGNPPYVTYPSVKAPYAVPSGAYRTLPAKNLYALMFERALQLVTGDGIVSFVVPLTVTSSERAAPLQRLLVARGPVFYASFPRRPRSVFEGVEMPVAIVTSLHGESGRLNSTRVVRFTAAERDGLMETLSYLSHDIVVDGHRWAKIGRALERDIVAKLAPQPRTVAVLCTARGEHAVFYQEACRYWVKAALAVPYAAKNGVPAFPAHWRTLTLRTREDAAFVFCLLNSSLFFWYYSVFSDTEHINDALVRSLPVPPAFDGERFDRRADALERDLAVHAIRTTISTRRGDTISYDERNAARSKPVIDRVDALLAETYGLTNAELGFILSYDAKYRLSEPKGVRTAGGDSEPARRNNSR